MNGGTMRGAIAAVQMQTKTPAKSAGVLVHCDEGESYGMKGIVK